ncbi:MAG: hypothetical protein HRU15_13705, partial [Planctomycetes bacterium]|nr:hypothetical protein [Planctomycetota bacterium]
MSNENSKDTDNNLHTNSTDKNIAAQSSWKSHLRIIIATFIGACSITYLSGVHSDTLHLGRFAATQMPYAVICYSLLIALIWNPLLSSLRQSWVYSGKELIAVCAVCFMCCWSFQTFPGDQMIAPVLAEEGQTLWKKHQLVQQIPEHLLLIDGNKEHQDFESVYSGYIQGINIEAGEDVPWSHWIQPLLQWTPFLLGYLIIGISLAMLVHKQWSDNEKLSYPIATAAGMLLQRDDHKRFPDIFYSRLLWCSFALIAGIHIYCIIHAWFPQHSPELALNARFNFLWSFRILNRTGSFWLTDFNIIFSAIGLSYFLNREVSLSLGITQILLLTFAIYYYQNT